PGESSGPRRTLSAAARRKVSLAQKARWAKLRSENSAKAKTSSTLNTGKRPMSAAGQSGERSIRRRHRNECRVFRVGSCDPGAAPAVHPLDRIWRRAHAASSLIALAASWFRSVGYPDRNPALDLPVNLGGKLPGGSGRDCAVPGWIPAALSRRVDLSEHSTWVAHRPGGCRVCRQSRHLCSPFPAPRARRLVRMRWVETKA